MTLRFVVVLAVLSLASACSTTKTGVSDAGSSAGGAEVAAAESPRKEDDPRVCKLITQVGTKVARRVCVRQSDWDAMQGTGSKVTTDMQNRAVQAGNPTNGG